MKGIDIYHGESKSGGTALKPVPQKAYDEADFVIVKATQGTSYKYTSFFGKMAKKVLADKKLLGAYHYAEGGDPVKEADYFLAIVKDYIGKALLCLDWESMQNKAWGSKTWCTKFINRVKEKTGVTCVLYTGTDGIKHNTALANKVPLWFAGYPKPMSVSWTVPRFKYSVAPWKDWAIWQYTSSNEVIDRNITDWTSADWKKQASAKKTETKATGMTEAELRNLVVNTAAMLIGVKEGSAEHKMIIDKFNASGLCTRYKMTTLDAWCATFVSFIFIVTKLAGKNNLFPCVECSCAKMVDLAKKYGIWNENDAYIPKPGDIILYHWRDSGKGDDKGTPNHVGVVQYVKDSYIYVIEGNYQDAVGIRKIAVNGRFIRGFICPKYGDYASKDKSTASTQKKAQTDAQEARKPYPYKYPALPPRGYFKFGDGYLQYRGFATQVRRVQKLVSWITGIALTEDGAYGQKTEDTVKKAQKVLGIKPDGLFGSDTLAKARAYTK